MKKVLSYFLKYNWKYKYMFILGIFLTILARALYNFLNFFSKFFVDSIQKTFDPSILIKLIVAFILVRITSDILDVLQTIVRDIVTVRSAKDLRFDVFKKLHDLDFSFHSSRQTGSLISISKRGDDAFFGLHDEIKGRLLEVCVDFVVTTVTFLYINVSLGVIIIIVTIINLFTTRLLIPTNINKRNKFNAKEDEVSGIIVDNLINYETVKYFAKEKREEQRLKKEYMQWSKDFWDYINSFRLFDISTNVLSVIGIALILSISIYNVSKGTMTIANLVLVITFIGTFFPKLIDMIFRLREIAKRYSDLERYFGILEIPIDVPEKEDAVEMNKVNGLIEFKNVAFNYPGRKDVINHINFTIQPKESIAFVGQSGAGKTTLTKLLLRFYDVSDGEILLDGVNIKDISKQSFRTNISMVPQEAVLFNDTIGYNIGYASDNPTQEDLERASKIANLYDFIQTLPDKFNTLVGERGIKLSGGQKQRLAIARVFVEDPSVIVFDEATSQLDSESEKLIQDAFWKVAKDKTVIIIAHRLSTVMRADRIIVFKEGSIIEEGTHNELIHKNGEYQKLWNLQKGGMI